MPTKKEERKQAEKMQQFRAVLSQYSESEQKDLLHRISHHLILLAQRNEEGSYGLFSRRRTKYIKEIASNNKDSYRQVEVPPRIEKYLSILHDDPGQFTTADRLRVFFMALLKDDKLQKRTLHDRFWRALNKHLDHDYPRDGRPCSRARHEYYPPLNHAIKFIAGLHFKCPDAVASSMKNVLVGDHRLVDQTLKVFYLIFSKASKDEVEKAMAVLKDDNDGYIHGNVFAMPSSIGIGLNP